MLFNSRSICNKLAVLHHIMYIDNLDMIFVTETWLHCGISDGLLDPNSTFTIVRKDRKGGRGGHHLIRPHTKIKI